MIFQKNQLGTIFLAIILVVGLASTFWFEAERKELLKDTKTVKAIIVWRDLHHTKADGSQVKYVVDGKEVIADVPCNCQERNVGDTVLIRYAIKKTNLARMVDKNYMDKYKISK